MSTNFPDLLDESRSGVVIVLMFGVLLFLE
jgi:hypothetical protein